MAEENKENFSKKIINCLKWLVVKCRYIAMAFVSFLIILIGKKLFVKSVEKEAEKKEQLKKDGDSIKDSLSDIKDTVLETSKQTKNASDILKENIKEKTETIVKINKTQQEKAKNLGFKKVGK